MDKFPLLRNGSPAGELTAEREALYTWFTARCALPEEGLWCAWAVGERGELRLGILEPEGGQTAVLRRRFSQRMTAPLGRLLRGEIRPAGAALWSPAAEPERLFQSPWLRQRLRNVQGALTRTEPDLRFLALPWDCRQPFPLATLFCFASLRTIRGGSYMVFTFDSRETPVFPHEKM